MTRRKFEDHIEAMKKYFPSIIALKEAEKISVYLHEMAMAIQNMLKGASPIDTLERLMDLREDLAKVLEECVYVSVVSDALSKSGISKKAEMADTSIGEGPRLFLNSLDDAIDTMTSVSSAKKLIDRLLYFARKARGKRESCK